MKDGVIKRVKQSQPVPMPPLVMAAIALALAAMAEDLAPSPPRPFHSNELFEGMVCGHEVTVTPDGQVFSYPVCTAGVTLDEIRLAAASHYLDRRGLNKDQYRYWAGIRQTTQLKNFESIRDRGRRG